MSRRFIVASSSTLKLAAATTALSRYGTVATSRATVTTSVVQPCGRAQARACARERMACVVNQHVDGDDVLVVAIESYLDVSERDMFETCLVLVGRDEYTYAESDVRGYGIALPSVFFPANGITPTWQQRTLGSRLAETFENPSLATDWYQAFDKNNVSREKFMQPFVACAYETFKRMEVIRSSMVTYKDFPTPGVGFDDIFASIADQYSRSFVVCMRERAYELIDNMSSCFIVGLESRGMMLGFALATMLACPFVPVRKAGKLPGPVERTEYAKEYGTDTFEMQTSYAERLPSTAIVVDDVLATGGSMAAACELVERLPGKRVGLVLALVDIRPLRAQWRAKLAKYTVALTL